MTSRQNECVRKASLDIIKENPEHLKKYFNKNLLKNKIIQKTINDFNGNEAEEFTFSPNHFIIDMKKRDFETLKKAYEIQPQNYEDLVSIKGVGPKAIRSLALISDLIYGTKISWKDPVKFSFAHGGKDSIPFPVKRRLMDDNAELLETAIKDAKLGNKEKLKAIRRLKNFYQ